MRIINLGGRDITIKATPLTPFYYKKAFNQSFSGDLIKLSNMGNDPSQFDDINLLQMVWAMEKTVIGQIKPFENWLSDFEHLNVTDVISDVVEVAIDATFHSRGEVKE